MSFGGRGRGRSPGGRGRGGGRGGGFRDRDEIPAEIVEAGCVAHECESELVCQWTLEDKVPYFNAGVFLQNKRKIGKVDEIFGKINDIFVSVKMDPGVQSKSFQPKDLVFVGTDKLLPLSRFTNPDKPGGGGRGRSPGGRGGRGGGRGGGRSPGQGRGGGRGFSSGGRGFSPGGRGFSGRGRSGGRGFGGRGRGRGGRQ